MSASQAIFAAAGRSMVLRDSAQETISFGDLPEDNYDLILSELAKNSFHDVLNAAQCTKSLRKAALPRVYRNITLATGPRGSKQETAHQALVDVFLHDRQGEIARHVRSITVLNEVRSEDIVSILERLAELRTLQSFSWNTLAPISQTILDKLHSAFPTLELSVSILDCQDARVAAHRHLDVRLLTSPLLTRLTYLVYNQGSQTNDPCHSEWSRLKEAFAAGGSLRALSLQDKQPGTENPGIKVVPDAKHEQFIRLNLTPDNRLSMLEELCNQCQQHGGSFLYLLDAWHGQILRESIDGTRMRTLDFREDNPESFFTALTDALPGLKSLRFGAAVGSKDPAVRFIESVAALESLSINYAHCAIGQLAPAIVKHKDTLRTLDFGNNFHAWYCIACIDRDHSPLFYGEDIIIPLLRRKTTRGYRN